MYIVNYGFQQNDALIDPFSLTWNESIKNTMVGVLVCATLPTISAWDDFTHCNVSILHTSTTKST